MMEQNLKLFLSIFICLFISCYSSDKPYTSELRRQLVIIVDKSKSVTYSGKMDAVKQYLQNQFGAIYNSTVQKMQYSTLIINDDTRVTPKAIEFEECKFPYPSSRSEKIKFDKWMDNKRRWINDNVDSILRVIQHPPSSNVTDIFSMFGGLIEVQKNNGPWNELKVVIFSDMIHTKGGNSIKGVSIDNAMGTGKATAARLLNEGRIDTTNISNLHFVIYTPDDMQESSKIYLFWQGFFEGWGIRKDQYQFRS